MIDFKIVEDTLRHLGIGGILGVLHDRDAPAFLDRNQADGAVIEHASQDHPDYPRSVRDGARAEQRIDGRPVTVSRAPFVTSSVSFLISS
jgi:hypothetical protein